MNYFSVRLSELKFRNRLIPSFYYFLDKPCGPSLYKKISEFADISDGEHSHIHRNNESGVRYLYGRNIKEQNINFDPISDDSFIETNDFEKFTRTHIITEDLLIAILGTIGKSAVYIRNFHGEMGIPRHIGRIRINSDVDYINNYFLSCYFRNKEIRKKIISLSTGNIQKLLSLKNIKEIDIPIPSKELLLDITRNEKKCIELQFEYEKKIYEAQQIIYDNLGFDIKNIKDDKIFSITYGDLSENKFNFSLSKYRTKFKKITDLIKSGCYIKIGDYFDYSTGIEVGSGAYIPYTDSKDSDIPFIRTSDIVNFYPDIYTDFFVDNKTKFKNYDIKKGDVLFSKDGKIGCCTFINDDRKVIFSSGFAKFTPKEGISTPITPEYLFATLSIKEIGVFQGLKGTVIASTIPHLRRENLISFVIPVLEKKYISKITSLIKEAFEIESEKLNLLSKNDKLMSDYLKSTNN